VDKAEDEKELANLINGSAPGVMARACAARGIPFVHISTDYVFDGTGETPWTEDMHADPVNHYGTSKLIGEQEVIAAGGSYAILRTAWVFAGHGQNFVRTMLRLGQTRDTLTVVEDQYGAPTWAGDIADALLVMTHALMEGKGESGIYHFTGAPYAHWADFARAIFAQSGKDVRVTGIPASDFPTKAARPANSRMDCQKIARVFGVEQPDWRKSLDIVLDQLGSDTDAA
jgi:dTDP-4-dehydrorhamnose reductase